MSQNPPLSPEPPPPPRGPDVPDPSLPGNPGSLPWPSRPGDPGDPGGPGAPGDPGDFTAPGEPEGGSDPLWSESDERMDGVYRRRRVMLGLGAVAAVVLVVGGIVWWQGRDDDGTTPEETVREFFDASMDQDCEELIDLVVERSWSQGGTVDRDTAIDQCNADLAVDADFDAELRTVDVTSDDGDNAVVSVGYTLEGEDIDTSLDLVKEDGDWKVDGV